jgi:hypothetical protein
VVSVILCHIMRLSVPIRARGLDASTRFSNFELGCNYVLIFLLGHIMRLSDPRGGRGVDV